MIDKTTVKNYGIYFLPLVFLGFAVYLSALHGKFVWDDYAIIVENPKLKDLGNVFSVFTKNIGAGPSATSDFYRPLQDVTNFLDYAFWGLHPFGYHLTSVFLHLLVVLSVFVLTECLYGDRKLAFLTALFFAVYPGHTEAVAYIAGRSDLLSALFMLWAFILYLRCLKTGAPKFLLFSLLSCGLALLSKENAVIFPALLLLYHVAFRVKIRWRMLVFFLSLAVVYAVMKISAPHFPLSLRTTLQRLPGFFGAMAGYTRLLLFPSNLHMDYGNPQFAWADRRVLAGLAVFGFLLVAGGLSCKRHRLVFFSIGWFLIALSPTSGICPPTGFYMAEHWLYFPSVGFFSLLAACLLKLFRYERLKFAAIFLIGAITVFYSWSTFKQNRYWRDPETVYRRTLQLTPSSYMAHVNLGSEYLKNRDYPKAMAEFFSAIQIKPDYAVAYHNICQIYVILGRAEEAVRLCRRTTELDPTMQSAYFFLGGAYEQLGRPEEALQSFQKTVEVDPAYFAAYNKLGKIYVEKGQEDLAEASWKKALQANPGSYEAHYNLTILYYRQGRYDLAIRHCDDILRSGGHIDPTFLQQLERRRGSLNR
jgi:tetratricopeptide (TPR) repeat protein